MARRNGNSGRVDHTSVARHADVRGTHAMPSAQAHRHVTRQRQRSEDVDAPELDTAAAPTDHHA